MLSQHASNLYASVAPSFGLLAKDYLVIKYAQQWLSSTRGHATCDKVLAAACKAVQQFICMCFVHNKRTLALHYSPDQQGSLAASPIPSPPPSSRPISPEHHLLPHHCRLPGRSSKMTASCLVDRQLSDRHSMVAAYCLVGDARQSHVPIRQSFVTAYCLRGKAHHCLANYGDFLLLDRQNTLSVRHSSLSDRQSMVSAYCLIGKAYPVPAGQMPLVHPTSAC